MGYIDVEQQVLTFFLGVLLGVGLCFFYDLIRVLHKLFLKGFFEILVSDLIFSVISSFITFCFLLIRCEGSVRAYVLLAVAVGFFITRMTVSKIYIKIILAVFKMFSDILHFITSLFHRILSPVHKYLKKSMLVIKKFLQVKGGLLYNQFKSSGLSLK